MKYYIEYPIPIKCNLHCYYCFHQEKWELDKAGETSNKYSETCAFTPLQFMAWRDKHLSDGESFLYELQGGELSCAPDVVFEIMDTLDKGKFQIQTNGTGSTDFYRRLITYKDKIDRIGFTYHRDCIPADELTAFNEAFERNVRTVKDAGIKVYVKELLLLKHKAAILVNKAYWEHNGVEFRIQDFKGYKGRTPETDLLKYTQGDWDLIYREYRHPNGRCCCRDGYKSILIRGYDIFRGDVIACWNDPTVIGNIVEDWYTPYSHTEIKDGDLEVKGVVKKYRGNYDRDIWSPEQEKIYGSNYFNKNQPTKEKVMLDWRKNRITELENEQQKTWNKLSDTRKELFELERLEQRLAGALTALREYDAAEEARMAQENRPQSPAPSKEAVDFVP